MKKRIADLLKELHCIENNHRHYVFGVNHIKYQESVLYVTDEVQFQLTTQVSPEQRDRIIKYIRNSYENVITVHFNEVYSLVVALFGEENGS
jgi:hypothetical protein